MKTFKQYLREAKSRKTSYADAVSAVHNTTISYTGQSMTARAHRNPQNVFPHEVRALRRAIHRLAQTRPYTSSSTMVLYQAAAAMFDVPYETVVYVMSPGALES